MEQGIYAIEVIQLAELLLQDALNVFPAKRANFVLFAGTGFEADAEPLSLLPGKLLPSSLPGATAQTVHASLVVTPHPFLDRSPRRTERFRNLFGGAALLGQHDGL